MGWIVDCGQRNEDKGMRDKGMWDKGMRDKGIWDKGMRI
jgi:hypothetical protein